MGGYIGYQKGQGRQAKVALGSAIAAMLVFTAVFALARQAVLLRARGPCAVDTTPVSSRIAVRMGVFPIQGALTHGNVNGIRRIARCRFNVVIVGNTTRSMGVGEGAVGVGRACTG